MGDGLYIFNMVEGVDNILYDLIDRYVLDALEQVQVGADLLLYLSDTIKVTQWSRIMQGQSNVIFIKQWFFVRFLCLFYYEAY